MRYPRQLGRPPVPPPPPKPLRVPREVPDPEDTPVLKGIWVARRNVNYSVRIFAVSTGHIRIRRTDTKEEQSFYVDEFLEKFRPLQVEDLNNAMDPSIDV